MKKLITLALVIFFIQNIGFAQKKVIYNNTVNKHYIIKYKSINSFNDKIIAKIAEGYSISRKQVKIDLSYKQIKKINRVGNKLTLVVNLGSFSLSGHTNYNSFPVNNLLIPDIYSCRVVLKKNGRSLILILRRKLRVLKFSS